MQDIDQRQCTIRGYLYGIVCRELRVWDRIAGARVFAVPSTEKEPNVPPLARDGVSGKRGIVRHVEKAEVDKFTANAPHDTTDEDGGFCVVDPDYDGGCIDLYVCIDRVPTPSLEEGGLPLPETECLFVGTFEPLQFGDTWYLTATIPQRLWCAIRRWADAWVIVGRVVSCDDDSVGIGALEVTAFDKDIVQHDNLGTATTNANGIFRIDYPGDRFRQGTIIDVELVGGPDVYFQIVDQSSNVLLDESALRGHQDDRRNRGPCFCVELCVPVDPPPEGVIPGVWTGIGTAFTIPDGVSNNDFDTDGYAGAARYAFHGAIRCTGSAPRLTVGGNPVEYRFLVSDTTTDNGTASPADASFSRIVGAGADIDLFVPTKVAQMHRPAGMDPEKTVNITAQLVDVDADGWFDVNAAIERTFLTDPTLTPADIVDFDFIDTDGLMAINTEKLTTEADVPLPGGPPGDAVPAGDRIAIEKKAIRFEIREVVDKALNQFNAMTGSGKTLNSMVMNNNPAVLKVAMAEHLAGGNACEPLSGAPPHVAFTAYHPHLRNVSVTVVSNDGSYSENLDDTGTQPATSDSNIPLSANTSEAIAHLHNPSVELPPALHRCTYIVTLSVLRRLHTGDGAVTANNAQTSFFYEP